MKTAALTSVLSLVFSCLFAQSGIKPPAGSERGDLFFGFYLGANYSLPQIRQVNTIDFTGVQTSDSPGFILGIRMDRNLCGNFVLNPKVELAFNNSRISMLQPNEGKLTYEVYPVILQSALHIAYRLNKDNLSSYLLLGPHYKIPVVSREEKGLLLSRSGDIGIDIGFGLDKAFTHFHFAPEIRYSMGLLNIGNDSHVQNIRFNSVALIFNFM